MFAAIALYQSRRRRAAVIFPLYAALIGVSRGLIVEETCPNTQVMTRTSACLFLLRLSALSPSAMPAFLTDEIERLPHTPHIDMNGQFFLFHYIQMICCC